MKKSLMGVLVFAATSFTSVLAASADYPPGSGSGGTPNLPATGASVLHDSIQYGNVALILGLGIIGSLAIRRRSIQK